MIDSWLHRDLAENSVVKMNWIPKTQMMADILTKKMDAKESFQKFNETGRCEFVAEREREGTRGAQEDASSTTKTASERSRFCASDRI